MNDHFISMASWFRVCLENRRRVVDGEYVSPGRYGGHKTIQNNRTLEATFRRPGIDDVSSHNLFDRFDDPCSFSDDPMAIPR